MDCSFDFGCLIASLRSIKMNYGKNYNSSNLQVVNYQKNIIKFNNEFKREYFKNKFETLKHTIDEENFFETFAGVYETDTDKVRIRDTIFILDDSIEDKLTFYVADENGSYQTLDNFIRFAKPGVEYIVFGSVDYHY